MTDAPRRDKRFPTKPELLVHCESWADFAQHYAADVSQGGMFVVTTQAPEILSEVEVSVDLPEGHKLQLKGTIVHVLDAAQAAAQGRQAGVGIAFSELGPEHKQQIVQLVEFARWEGSDPSASLARRMFETSAALPPSKVLDALPGPAAGATTQRSMPVAQPPGQTSMRAGATTQRSMPVAEPPQPTSARAGAASQRSMPAVEPSRPAAPQTGATTQRSMPAAEAPQTSRSDRPAEGAHRSVPAAEPSSSRPPLEPGSPKPLDAAKLRLGMTHLTHKRLEQALKTFQELMAESPGDRQAAQWLYITHARMRLKADDEGGASQYYQKVLEVDEANHEARKFVRDFHQNKRLGALPFGRYFVKKK